MAVILDHVVLRVGDLGAAVAEFTRAGLTVTPGGKHPAWGSENALVVFDDDTYLELISFPASRPREPRAQCMARLNAEGRDLQYQRMASWGAVDSGLIDYAVRPVGRSPLAPELRRLGAAGVGVFGPVAGARERPDGQRVAWEMGTSDNLALPFFCADVTAPALRMPSGAARQHANGALGIAAVRVLSATAIDDTRALAALFGQPPAAQGAGSVRFDLPHWQLSIELPADDEQRAALAARGAGPWRLDVRTAGAATLSDLRHYGLFARTA